MDTDPNVSLEAKPERRRLPIRLVGLSFAMMLAGMVLGGGGVWLTMHDAQVHAAGPASQLYQCPMHPAITSDHPGDCPICGMKLVAVKQEQAASKTSATPQERKIKLYRSPMDPKQTSPVPRKDEMGMDFIPVYEDEVQRNADQQVKGLATVSIDVARQQLIGLRVTTAKQGPVVEAWRTVARVQVDPTRVRKTNVKVDGYIERMYVDFVGRAVRKGEPLFSIYSPAILVAENEYLLALRTRDALADGGLGTGDADSLATSARRKLELWDVPSQEITRIEQTRQSSKTLSILSPISGVVTAKNVVEGARVSVGDTPFEITDLGVVWVMADVYEVDLARVRVGMPALLTLQAYANRSFKGKVDFVDPVLDPKSRTAKVHVHFPNPTRELKPEMFGEVELEGLKREGLLIPSDAVIRSGDKNVVFVSLGEGRFEPREVQLETQGGDQVEVVAGLSAGQEVVTRANFLVDSESQLRSSLSSIGGK